MLAAAVWYVFVSGDTTFIVSCYYVTARYATAAATLFTRLLSAALLTSLNLLRIVFCCACRAGLALLNLLSAAFCVRKASELRGPLPEIACQ